MFIAYKWQMMEIKKRKITSPIKKKILLLFVGGLALGFARNPRTQKIIFEKLKKEWKNIDEKHLHRIVWEFKRERLVDYGENKNGITDIILTEKGKKIALSFDIDRIKIAKPMEWDGKWRIVFFDVPEKRRAERNVLRNKLKELGFSEIQKSVFVHPFPCLKEIDFITEYFQMRNLVRYGEMINLSNEEELRLRFKLH